MAEQLPGPYQGRREVDRAEDDHAGRRHGRLHEQGETARALRAVLGELDRAGAAGVQQGAGLTDRRAVQVRGAAETAFVQAVGAYEHRPAEEVGGPPGHPGESHRFAAGGRRQRGGRGRPAGVVRGDHDVDGSAAGQTDGEGVLVAVAEPLDERLPLLERMEAEVVHGSLHAAPGDRADDGAVGADGQGGAGRARGAAADGDDRGDGELPALLDPLVQLPGQVKHRRPPSGHGRAGSAGSGGVRRSRATRRWRPPRRHPRCRSHRCP